MDRLARRVRQTLLSGEGRERMRHGARKGLALLALGLDRRRKRA